MKKRLFYFVAGMLFLGWYGMAEADSLTINNPGFEDGTSGWTITGVAGFYIPSSDKYDDNSTNPSNPYTPEGRYAGYIGYGSIHQTLDDDYAADTEYTISFFSGRQKGYTDYSSINVDFSFRADDTAFFTRTASATTLGGWTEFSFSMAATDIPDTALGDAIELWFTPGSTFYQINIDNVRIEAVASQTGQTPVPEPATILLMGFGLVGLAAACRRKKQPPAF